MRGGPARRLRGQARSKEELLARDLEAMRELPADRFEACRVEPTRASSLSLVRFDANDYSVPVCYAHREVVAKGDCERVAIHSLRHALLRPHSATRKKPLTRSDTTDPECRMLTPTAHPGHEDGACVVARCWVGIRASLAFR